MLKPTVDMDVIPFSKNFENKTHFFTSLYMADDRTGLRHLGALGHV